MAAAKSKVPFSLRCSEAEIILHTSTGHMVHMASASSTGRTGGALVVWLYWAGSGSLAELGLALVSLASAGLACVVWLNRLVCVGGVPPAWPWLMYSLGVCLSGLRLSLFIQHPSNTRPCRVPTEASLKDKKNAMGFCSCSCCFHAAVSSVS